MCICVSTSDTPLLPTLQSRSGARNAKPKNIAPTCRPPPHNGVRVGEGPVNTPRPPAPSTPPSGRAVAWLPPAGSEPTLLGVEEEEEEEPPLPPSSDSLPGRQGGALPPDQGVSSPGGAAGRGRKEYLRQMSGRSEFLLGFRGLAACLGMALAVMGAVWCPGWMQLNFIQLCSHSIIHSWVLQVWM